MGCMSSFFHAFSKGRNRVAVMHFSGFPPFSGFLHDIFYGLPSTHWTTHLTSGDETARFTDFKPEHPRSPNGALVTANHHLPPAARGKCKGIELGQNIPPELSAARHPAHSPSARNSNPEHFPRFYCKGFPG